MAKLFPIVGAFYRPPAPALLEVLPQGCEIILMAEPENNYDSNAVAVYVTPDQIPEAAYERLEEILTLSGFSLEEIVTKDYWQLGYIGKEFAAQLRAQNIIPENTNIKAKFMISSKSKPFAELSDL